MCRPSGEVWLPIGEGHLAPAADGLTRDIHRGGDAALCSPLCASCCVAGVGSLDESAPVDKNTTDTFGCEGTARTSARIFRGPGAFEQQLAFACVLREFGCALEFNARFSIPT